MAIEAATYLADLVTTNPPGTDPVSQGDDVFRLIKTVLQATFPSASGVWVDLVHTWSAKQTFTGTIEASGTGVAATPLELISTDAAAAAGPIRSSYRNSASVIANDYIGADYFYGKDSAGNKELYAGQRVGIVDPTSTNEDGQTEWGVITAGSFAWELALTGATLYPLTNAGLDLGASSFRFGTAYINTLNAAAGGTLGDASGDTVVLKGTTLSTYMASILDTATKSALLDSMLDSAIVINPSVDEFIIRDNTDGSFNKITLTQFFIDMGTTLNPATLANGDILIGYDVSTSSLRALTVAGL